MVFTPKKEKKEPAAPCHPSPSLPTSVLVILAMRQEFTVRLLRQMIQELESKELVFTRLSLVNAAVDYADNLTITSFVSACGDGSQLPHISPI